MPDARDILCKWCGAAPGDDCFTPKNHRTARFHHVRVLGSMLGPSHDGAVAKVAALLAEKKAREEEAARTAQEEPDDAG
jgi:hypothetical protein